MIVHIAKENIVLNQGIIIYCRIASSKLRDTLSFEHILQTPAGYRFVWMTLFIFLSISIMTVFV